MNIPVIRSPDDSVNVRCSPQKAREIAGVYKRAAVHAREELSLGLAEVFDASARDWRRWAQVRAQQIAGGVR